MRSRPAYLYLTLKTALLTATAAVMLVEMRRRKRRKRRAKLWPELRRVAMTEDDVVVGFVVAGVEVEVEEAILVWLAMTRRGK